MRSEGAKVEYCKNSTIKEAYALVLGLPAKVDETEPILLIRSAKERIEDLRAKPALVTAVFDPALAAPFWNRQLSWKDGRFLARFGHRYLGVHFWREHEDREGDRYETFQKTVRPWIDLWLGVYSSALGPTAAEHVVHRVAFGYVNCFDFEAAEFDLSEYFKLNITMEMGPVEGGLIGLTAGCEVFDRERNAGVAVNVLAVSTDEKHVRVVTQVIGQRLLADRVSFADGEKLGAEIVRAKDAAKVAFFNLATDKTHLLMGAVTNASSAT